MHTDLFNYFIMSYTEDYIKSKLQKELEATHIEVHDESDGCGAKFSVLIVSEKFEGKPLLQRHRYKLQSFKILVILTQLRT
ncbi:BolA-like protein 2 [Zootermopsis nevadensis]|uniref:BolA-like protein 2 n=1 Tax=Zootermopsis nevadensis TaxID=136037 RepID=A0A067RV64_ZOONE|nr:BolA-like protein 2 [Zootermopsis nevadensis]